MDTLATSTTTLPQPPVRKQLSQKHFCSEVFSKKKTKAHFREESFSEQALSVVHLNYKIKCELFYSLGCCIYEKPRMFGESSSEDEDETGHCRGHKGHCYKADGGNNPGNKDGDLFGSR